MKQRKIKLCAVDFFCSGGGMSYGLKKAGINVIAGIDIDISCKDTYETNVKNAKFIHADITKFAEVDLKKYINVRKRDNNLIFVGCSPCQFWSPIQTNKSKSKESRNLLRDFERFVVFYLPGFVLVENVPGILSKKNESGLSRFIKRLERLSYKVEYKIVNLNEFGVPQKRKRFSLVASRVTSNSCFPVEEKNYRPVVKDFIGVKNGFCRISAGHKDKTEFMHSASELSEVNLQRIKRTPKNGGTRLAWAQTSLQLNTYKKRDINSFTDTYGRMHWNKPAPTITTKFFSISNGRFGHPEENRALSLREGARLQTFPDNFIFETKTISATARIIGNAVPPEFAKKVGRAILRGIIRGTS